MRGLSLNEGIVVTFSQVKLLTNEAETLIPGCDDLFCTVSDLAVAWESQLALSFDEVCPLETSTVPPAPSPCTWRSNVPEIGVVSEVRWREHPLFKSREYPYSVVSMEFPTKARSTIRKLLLDDDEKSQLVKSRSL